MRRLVFLSLLCMPLVLSACASPRALCMDRATRDLRVVQQLIAESRATLDRGYALRTETVVDEVFRLCTDRKGRQSACWVPVAGRETRPEAVDLNAERAKLASLIAKRDQLQRESAQRVAACRAAYPEG